MDLNLLEGMIYIPNWLDLNGQIAMVEEVRQLAKQAPFYQLKTPGGQLMSVKMTNFGAQGWISDHRGYRYEPIHPFTHKPWPAMPKTLIKLWQEVGKRSDIPDCCLCNFYDEHAKVGLHQDINEQDLSAPVITLSLGDPGLFSFTPTKLKKDGSKIWLNSGDAFCFGGKSRLAYHGIDKLDIGAGPVGLLKTNGRISLTLRKVFA